MSTGRHCEEQSDEAIQLPSKQTGLLRFARNDDIDPAINQLVEKTGTAALNWLDLPWLASLGQKEGST
jgi:hypothetical protein